MFGTVTAVLTGYRPMARRNAAVVIPFDRPDLMADAGYDGMTYKGGGSRIESRRDRRGWCAISWMPFLATAG